MNSDIKNVLPKDAATIDQITQLAGFQAAAGAVKFKEHLSKDDGRLLEAWSGMGWYEKDTASFALLAAKTIQSGYSINTLTARLRVLALLKIIRPTGTGGRMPKAPPEGSPFGDMWPHQRLGYNSWGEFVLGPPAGISGPDGAFIKGPGLGFGHGIKDDDPEADEKRQRALKYEQDLFRGYQRLMDLLPETALPHSAEDLQTHFRASLGGELTVDAIEKMGQKGTAGRTLSDPDEKPEPKRRRVISQDPEKAAVTVQQAAETTDNPKAYIRKIAEIIQPPAPDPVDCLAELVERHDNAFLRQLLNALSDYLETH